MEQEMNLETLNLDTVTKEQINQCLNLVHEIFEQDLLGVYLYGSSVFGGLQKYSDIDLLVVVNRSSTLEEKTKLAGQLLQISGIYMKNTKCPIEMTIVEQVEVNPWRYPPKFDFQYGDWLRELFETGIIEPWPSKEMPDLALLITQVLLASRTLVGTEPEQLLCKVPYQDFMIATTDALDDLMSELESDTRNVLLALARIWSTVETDAIRSKPIAADWVIRRLPKLYAPVMKRAKSICKGEEKENWDDIRKLIKPCADFIIAQISKAIDGIKLSDNTTKSIKLSEV
jgi:streptomycin 3"-adenylyltransferase